MQSKTKMLEISANCKKILQKWEKSGKNPPLSIGTPLQKNTRFKSVDFPINGIWFSRKIDSNVRATSYVWTAFHKVIITQAVI